MKYNYLKKQYYRDKSPDKASYTNAYHERLEGGVKLDFDINGYPAFYVEDVELFKTIIDIQRVHEKICELSFKLPPIALNQYVNRCLIDEIILTNDIEGVYSTRKEIGAVLADLEKKDRKKRFFGLVNKYRMLSERQHIELNDSRDVRALYDELFYQEVLEEDPDDIPEDTVIKAMDKALAILNDQNIDIVIRIGLFHYLFGYIHPFYEGNGRMSRFISSYMMTQAFHPLTGYKLSYVIKEDLIHYYKAFRECSDIHNRGDLTPFILMFADAFRKMCNEIYEDLEQRYQDLMALKLCIPNLTDDEQKRSLYFYLMQASLFSESGIPTQGLLELTEVSRPTLSKRLGEIEAKGLLKTQMIGKVKYYQLELDNIRT